MNEIQHRVFDRCESFIDSTFMCINMISFKKGPCLPTNVTHTHNITTYYHIKLL